MTILEAAIEILREQGPLHYKDITRIAIERNLIQLSTLTPERSVATVLSNEALDNSESPSIIRVARGVFAAVENDENAQADEGLENICSETIDEREESESTGDRQPSHLSFREAAYKILKDSPPMNYRDITDLALEKGYIVTTGKTPHASMYAVIVTNMKEKGNDSPFIKTGTGVFTIKEEPKKHTEVETTIAHEDDTHRSEESDGPEKVTQLEAAYEVLKASGPLHYKEITRLALENGLISTSGKTPHESVNSRIAVDIKNNPKTTPFVRIKPGIYTLREVNSCHYTNDLTKESSRLDMGEAATNPNQPQSPTQSSNKTILEKQSTSPDYYNKINELLHLQKEEVREELKRRIQTMAPQTFEHFVKRLLEKMNYKSVRVTPYSRDGGIDIVAKTGHDITSVVEVIQVKRTKKKISRPVLDMLRGSLHRYNADRGMIITISDFTRAAQQAAEEGGAVTITLINGDQLTDLMFDNNFGITKETFQFYSIDEGEFEKEI